jgi:hypothetical protein
MRCTPDETHICDTLAYVDPEGIKARRKRSNRIIYSPMKALEVLRAAGDTSELLILQEVESSASSEASNAGEDGNGEDGIGEVVRMPNLVSTCPLRNVLFSLGIWIRSVWVLGKTHYNPP